MRLLTPSYPLLTTWSLALFDCEKAEALAYILEAQYQPVLFPTDPATIDNIDEALITYSFTSAGEPKLTNSSEVQEIIRASYVGRHRSLMVYRTGL
jgi:hypothetical protein